MASLRRAPLRRTLSSANKAVADKIYSYKQQQYYSQTDQTPQLNREVIKSSMILPTQFGVSVLELCVDVTMLYALEHEKSINWCKLSRYLLPLYIEQDGNSCLHSISMYIYGVHDRDLTLRKLLYQRLFMENAGNGKLFTRWKNNQRQLVEHLQSPDSSENLISLLMDWKNVISLSSPEMHEDSVDAKFSEIDPFHIFVMANILGRAIIVLSHHECNENNFGYNGIYLPLLRNSHETEKSPIVLGYTCKRFSPLISSENLHIPLCQSSPASSALHCIPLVQNDFTMLPIKFLLPEEEGNVQHLLIQYLEFCDSWSDEKGLPAAWLRFKPPPAQSIELLWSLHQLCEAFQQTQHSQVSQGSPQNQHAPQQTISNKVPCARNKVKDCPNYSAGNKENLCHGCYEEFLKEKSRIPKRTPVSRSIKENMSSGHLSANSNEILDNNDQIYRLNKNVSLEHKKEVNEEAATKNSNGCADDSYLKHCSTRGCTGIGFPFYGNLCKSCSKESYNNSYVSHDYDVDSSYIPARSPLLSTGNAYQTPVTLVTGRGAISYSTQKSEDDTNELRVLLPPNYNSATDKENTKNMKLCAIPGCSELPEVAAKYCERHTMKKKKTKCILEDCTNSADDNDFGLCLFCFRKQSHKIRELNPNIGRGFVPQYDRLNSNDKTISDIPPMPKYQSSNSNRSFSQPFAPPSTYEGFSCASSINYGNQKGVMNWQKEQVSHNFRSPSLEQNCQYCDNKAVSGKNGCCDICFELQKNINGRSEDNELKKCVNDGCRSPGNPGFAYLCQTCFAKQLSNLRVQDEENRNVGLSNNQPPAKPLKGFAAAQDIPCTTKGCIFLATYPSTLCEACKDKRPFRDEIRQPVAAEVILNKQFAQSPCKGLDCEFFGSHEFGGYCSACFMETTKRKNNAPIRHSGIETYVPRSNTALPPMNVGVVYNSLPLVDNFSAGVPCRQQDCDCFGRREWNGYCSMCYKKQQRVYVERDTVHI